MENEVAVYLIPVTLGDTPVEQVLPSYNRDVILRLRHFVVENVRSARRFLKRVERSLDIDALTFYELNEHTSDAAGVGSVVVGLCRSGESVGIISEAGCPAVADPGADVVAVAQQHGIRVVPLVGPSSILLTVMAAGMNGQSFAFNGYLPIDDARRTERIRQLERRATSEGQTQLFIETPYRNARLVEQLLATLQPSTRLCIASDVTCADESIVTRTVRQWRDARSFVVPRVPTMFAIGR